MKKPKPRNPIAKIIKKTPQQVIPPKKGKGSFKRVKTNKINHKEKYQ